MMKRTLRFALTPFMLIARLMLGLAAFISSIASAVIGLAVGLFAVLSVIEFAIGYWQNGMSWLSVFFMENTPSSWRHIRIVGISITTLFSAQRRWTAPINSEMCGTPAGLLLRSATSFVVSIIFRSFRFRRTKPFPTRNGRVISPN